MIKELTALRGVFILFIFIHHLDLYASGGSLGVAFFFVLSGFSLTIGYGDRILTGNCFYKRYCIRRLSKFFPLHWVCLLLSVPYVLIKTKTLMISSFVMNAALLQTWIPSSEFYFSFNSVSWYLADTVFLALIFPFVCRFLLLLNRRGLVLFSVFFYSLYIVLQSLLYNHGVFYYTYINPLSRIPDLVTGILLAIAIMNLRKGSCVTRIKVFVSNNTASLVIICLVSIVGLIIESSLIDPRQTEIAAFYWPLVIVAILTASLLSFDMGGGNSLRNKVLVRFGEMSFEFYMIHQIIIRYTRYFISLENDGVELFVTLTISFFLSAFLGYILHTYFKRPVRQKLSDSLHNNTL